MLREPDTVESARQARRCVAVIRKKLLNPTPEALGTCAPHLHTAIDSLARLQRAMRNSNFSVLTRGNLQREVAALGEDLRQINALMRNAGAFYIGLANLLNPQPDESIAYTPGGPLPIRAAPTLRVEG